MAGNGELWDGSIPSVQTVGKLGIPCAARRNFGVRRGNSWEDGKDFRGFESQIQAGWICLGIMSRIPTNGMCIH